MLSVRVNDDIVLRCFSIENAEELFNVINESRQHLRPWLNWVDDTTGVEHSREFISFSNYNMEAQEEIVLGVFYLDKIIGCIGMHNWDYKVKRAQLGYWIAKPWEGKGIISTCLKTFINFIFENLKLNKIEIHFVSSNIRSAKIAQKLNFKIEGVIRDAVLRNGLAEDLVITGLLRGEWEMK